MAMDFDTARKLVGNCTDSARVYSVRQYFRHRLSALEAQDSQHTASGEKSSGLTEMVLLNSMACLVCSYSRLAFSWRCAPARRVFLPLVRTQLTKHLLRFQVLWLVFDDGSSSSMPTSLPGEIEESIPNVTLVLDTMDVVF